MTCRCPFKSPARDAQTGHQHRVTTVGGPCSSEQKKSLGGSREKQKIRHDLAIAVGEKIFLGYLFRLSLFSNPSDRRSRLAIDRPKLRLLRRGPTTRAAIARSCIVRVVTIRLTINPASVFPYRSRPNPSSARTASGADHPADRRLQPCPSVGARGHARSPRGRSSLSHLPSP